MRVELPDEADLPSNVRQKPGSRLPYIEAVARDAPFNSRTLTDPNAGWYPVAEGMSSTTAYQYKKRYGPQGETRQLPLEFTGRTQPDGTVTVYARPLPPQTTGPGSAGA